MTCVHGREGGAYCPHCGATIPPPVNTCSRASHEALKADAITFAKGTRYVGPSPEGVLGNCLKCGSTLAFELGSEDETYPFNPPLVAP